MAPTTPNTGTADQLVASLLPAGIPAPKLRKCKDAFSKKLKVHNYARTNQFEVAERLDGLQEKFQIFNNDELADALHTRLAKLKLHSEKWLPDILDLLLRLSDDPTNKTKIEGLAKVGTLQALVPSLTWSEIEADDPIDRKDQIWEVAEYSDLSSDDDDVVVVGRKTPVLDISIPKREEQELSSQVKLEPVHPNSGQRALDRLQGDQFWHTVSKESFELTELQVIRELLFMLQGFPTALFWRVGTRFEIDQRFRLYTNSREAFVGVLFDFGQIATRLDLLRDFVKKPQTERFMQTLCSTLEEILRHIDGQLYTLEQNILAVKCEGAATILQVFADVSSIVEVICPLALFVARIPSGSVDIVYCLEQLFHQVCQTQASGHEIEFQCLLKIFFQCFETYFRPLQEWMDQGTLCEHPATVFITRSRLDQDYSGLWQEWYKMANDSATNRCPDFLRSVKSPIFSTGKTVVFLQLLHISGETFAGPPMRMPHASTLTSANSLLPFSELLANSVQDFVEARLQVATGALRDHLGNSCGLWKTFAALNAIYFGRSGYITDLIDMKIFTAIDRCDKNWNDRFLLGDLLQTVFEPIESVEVERLALKSCLHPNKNMPKRRQSVKILNDLQIQYTLHWSVANVITTSSLASYQRISTFLTQIRRARYMLERRSLSQVQTSRPEATPRERSLTHLLHHNLLLFVNILYSHLTTLVIEEATSELRQDLANAPDIDAMIVAHDEYCIGLENECLTSNNLKPIHNAIISMLDLCVRFSDLNNPTKPRTSSNADVGADADAETDTDAHSYVSATSHLKRRRRRRRSNEEDTSSSEEVESDGGEGYSTFIMPEESTLVDQLRKVRGEYDRHLSFVVAGLSSIGRVGERGSSWEMLGGRLDWRRRRRTV